MVFKLGELFVVFLGVGVLVDWLLDEFDVCFGRLELCVVL